MLAEGEEYEGVLMKREGGYPLIYYIYNIN